MGVENEVPSGHSGRRNTTEDSAGGVLIVETVCGEYDNMCDRGTTEAACGPIEPEPSGDRDTTCGNGGGSEPSEGRRNNRPALTISSDAGRLCWNTELCGSDWALVSVVCSDGQLCVSMRESIDSIPIVFYVKVDCMKGTCDCIYLLAGTVCQLKPCRFFSELFGRGETDIDACFILQSVVFGFKVIDEGFLASYDSVSGRKKSNWEKEVIELKLRTEIDMGIITRVEGPPQCVHGIFVVPKDDGSGRTVVDCSRPRDNSVNTAVSEVASKFSYQGVDDVVYCMEKGDYMASIDIKDAYRAVHIHPRDRLKQGLKWHFSGEGSASYMIDNRLCMGLSSSPFIFNRLSDFVVRCGVREGVKRTVNYLDDFCVIGGDSGQTRRHQLILISIIRRLGFFISFRKLKSPTKKIRFLGIDIDSDRLELSLPSDKLEKLLILLADFKGKRKARRLELERLAGIMAHCAKVVRGGRTFSRRIYDLIGGVREPYYKTRLNAGFRRDIDWWSKFASTFNGKAAMLGKFAQTLGVYSDASNWGFGATHLNDWLVGTFGEPDEEGLRGYAGHHVVSPEEGVRQAHINVKEAWAVYAGAQRWASAWRDSVVLFVTDSAVVQSALNSGRSRSPEIMGMLRKMFWLAVEHNFVFSATYINTKVNVVCDALSRLDKPCSRGRIMGVDGNKSMCCHTIFESPFSLSLQECRS